MAAVEILIWGIAVSFFGGAWLAGRFAPVLLTLIFPIAWIVFAAVFVARGELTSFRDYLLAMIGLVVTVIAVGSGADRRRRHR